MSMDTVIPIVIVVGTLGYICWSVYDISRFPDEAFEAIGESRSKVILRLAMPFGTGGPMRVKLLRWQDDQQGIKHEKRKHLVPSPALAILNVLPLVGILYAFGLWWDGRPTSALLVGVASVVIFTIIHRTLTERMRRGDY